MDGIKTRREHIRKRALITIQVRTVTGLQGEKRDCTQARFVGLNMSVNGMGLETLFELKVNESLEMEFILTDTRPIAVTAIIRSVTTEARGKHTVYRAGTEFVLISEEDRKLVANYVANMGIFV